MDFVIQWLCYLLVFLGGLVVVWVVVILLIKCVSCDEGVVEVFSVVEIGVQ